MGDLMGKRVGLLAGLLVLALGSGVVAQDPSASPPPWFGGRVEMAEHGFAVTLPDDWVAFDPAADAVSQYEAASDSVEPAMWSADVLVYAALQGHQLVLIDATGDDVCGVVNYRGLIAQVDAIADYLFEMYVDSPDARDVEPPQRITLPAGPAYVVRVSERYEPGADAWVPLSVWYLGGADGVVLAMACSTDGAGLEGDWLSIAETFEFLPAEE